MKTPVNLFFEKWLDLMEEAFAELPYKEFTKLEDKIKHEIGFHRKKKKNKKTGGEG